MNNLKKTSYYIIIYNVTPKPKTNHPKWGLMISIFEIPPHCKGMKSWQKFCTMCNYSGLFFVQPLWQSSIGQIRQQGSVIRFLPWGWGFGYWGRTASAVPELSIAWGLCNLITPRIQPHMCQSCQESVFFQGQSMWNSIPFEDLSSPLPPFSSCLWFQLSLLVHLHYVMCVCASGCVGFNALAIAAVWVSVCVLLCHIGHKGSIRGKPGENVFSNATASPPPLIHAKDSPVEYVWPAMRVWMNEWMIEWMNEGMNECGCVSSILMPSPFYATTKWVPRRFHFGHRYEIGSCLLTFSCPWKLALLCAKRSWLWPDHWDAEIFTDIFISQPDV